MHVRGPLFAAVVAGSVLACDSAQAAGPVSFKTGGSVRIDAPKR